MKNVNNFGYAKHPCFRPSVHSKRCVFPRVVRTHALTFLYIPCKIFKSFPLILAPIKVFQSFVLLTESNAVLKSTNATYSLPRLRDRLFNISVCSTNALSIVPYHSLKPAWDSSILLNIFAKKVNLRFITLVKIFPNISSSEIPL